MSRNVVQQQDTLTSKIIDFKATYSLYKVDHKKKQKHSISQIESHGCTRGVILLHLIGGNPGIQTDLNRRYLDVFRVSSSGSLPLHSSLSRITCHLHCGIAQKILIDFAHQLLEGTTGPWVVHMISQ